MKKRIADPAARRNFLKAAATASAAATGILGARTAAAAQAPAAPRAGAAAAADDGGVMQALSAYIAGGATATLPNTVVESAKSHILDTFAAMVSGAKLIPGQFATRYILAQEGKAEAQVVATGTVTSAVNAAFANGMMAHADETDDSHRWALVHPGAAVVPAALAMSERENVDGRVFLRSVVIGYDIGCRMIMALDRDRLLQGSGATPGIGGCFGAAAASAVVARIDKSRIPIVLSYAVQQASGVNTWMRDQEHVEKAFVFGGMPARNGVTAAQLIQFGFTGVPDAFSGPDNFFAAFSSKPDLSKLTATMGREYEIVRTDMKRFPVGFPIQAATDGMLKLIARGLVARDLRSLTIRLPAPGVRTVNDRSMPDVNVQYILAATLIDGSLSFDTAHSLERMKDPAVLDLKKRITLVEDTGLTAQQRTREANIDVVKTDGTTMNEHGISRGAIENPMTRDELENKARDLMGPVLGAERAGKLIQAIWNLEQLQNMRELRPLLTA
jgi:2-methylcitrate dehydratase PrpD